MTFCNYVYILYLARVVQTFDSVILRIKLINHYLVNKYSGNQLHYPLDSAIQLLNNWGLGFSRNYMYQLFQSQLDTHSTVEHCFAFLLAFQESVGTLFAGQRIKLLALCCPTYSNRLMPLIRRATDRHFISIRIRILHEFLLKKKILYLTLSQLTQSSLLRSRFCLVTQRSSFFALRDEIKTTKNGCEGDYS